MATLGQVMVEVGADLKDFEKSMQDVEKRMRQTGRTLSRTGDTVADGISDSFDDVYDSIHDTSRGFDEFGRRIRRVHQVSAKNLKNLPEHLKPFAESIHTTQRSLKYLSRNGANDLDTLRDSVMKTRVGFDQLTSVTSSGKKVIKVISDMKEETKLAKMAVLGFNKDATVKLSTAETQAQLKKFQKSLDNTKKKLEAMRDAGDVTGYTQGMRQLAEQTRDVDRAMQATARGGDAYLSMLERMGIMTEAVGNRAAINMERMKDSFILSNERMQGMATQSSKIIKNLDRMQVRSLDQQILKVADSLETMAKRGSAANVALREVGKGASMKEINDQVRLINTGLMRMQMLQMGMGIGMLGFTIAMVKLSNAVDGRLVPAGERFKETWLKALTPIAKGFTDMALVVIKLGTKIGELFGKFTEANPELAALLGQVVYLTGAFVLLLSPLAIGISRVGAMAVAFNALWMLIGPFVQGFLAVIGTALTVAAAIAVATYAVVKLWKNSEAFRSAVTGIWESVKTAVLTAVQPIQDKWVELKAAFSNLVSTFTGGGSSMGNIWQILGDKIASVINIAKPLIVTVFGGAFKILSAIVVPILNGLIAAFNWVAEIWQQNSGKIQAVTGLIWNYIVMAFNAVNEYLKVILPQVISIITNAFNLVKQALSVIMPIIQNIISKVWPIIKKIISVVMPIVLSLVVNTWNNIKTAITSAVNIIQNVIKLFSNILKGNWKGAWENVKNILKNALSLVWSWIQLTILGKVLKLFKGLGGKVGSALSNLKDKILKPFKDGANKAQEAVNSLKTKVTTKMGEMKSTITSKLSDLKDKISKPFTSAWDKIKDIPGKIKGAFTKLKIKIPKPHIPKVSIDWKTIGKGKASVKIPTIHWNAKGNIFQGASILGGGQGVGEAGTEAVMPIGRKRLFAPWAGMVSELLAENFEDSGTAGVTTKIEIAQLVVREEADIDRIATLLEKKQRQQQRAKGGYVYA